MFVEKTSLLNVCQVSSLIPSQPFAPRHHCHLIPLGLLLMPRAWQPEYHNHSQVSRLAVFRFSPSSDGQILVPICLPPDRPFDVGLLTDPLILLLRPATYYVLRCYHTDIGSASSHLRGSSAMY
jgi:hypothetical protein